MYDTITPEQGAKLLEQAQNGEFDLDNLNDDDLSDDGLNDDNSHDNSTNNKQADDANHQDGSQTQTPVDYMAILAQERAEKLALQEQLAQYQANQNAQNTEQVPNPEEMSKQLAELFGDFDEEGIKKGVEYLVQQKLDEVLAQKIAPLEQKQAYDAYQEHINAITSVHPDAQSIVNSNEFVDWVKTQPSYIQPSIVAVVEQGSAEQVNELLSNYKASLPQAQTPPKDKTDTALTDSTPPIPNSLSQLGGSTPTDPNQALAKMSGVQIMDAMQNMTPEQIESYLNRL